ncbi:MAG: radical SAM protein [Elusimicrobia bacterium]|nr:radical SAM protein [Elusimicrobiota bacterium]
MRNRLSETSERYALGLARSFSDRQVPQAGPGRRRRLARSLTDRQAPAAPPSPRVSALLDRLVSLGIKGWPERMTLHTGPLPRGCVPCLKGRGSNVSLTTLCNRDCFFCFNPKPRADDLSVHGRGAGSVEEAGRILASQAPASVGISGGEPLLFPDRTLALIRKVRERLPKAWIDLYTNGGLLTRDLLERLKAAGTGSLRINLAANAYDTSPVRLALLFFPDLAVEIPVIPGHEPRLRRLMTRLEELGARHLILHELFRSGHNADRLDKAGLLRRAAPRLRPGLTWSGEAASGESCLRLLAWAMEKKFRLGVYYCSTGTQAWIAEKALGSGVRDADA